MSRTNARPALLVVAAALLAVPAPAVAQTYTWGGGAGNGNWNTAGNWDTPPVSGSATVITLAGTTQTATSQNITSPFVLNQLAIDSTATAGFSVDGSQIQFAGTSPQFLQNSGGAVSITAPLDLSAGTSFGGTGSGSVMLAGNITGSGALTKTGAHTLVLSGLNSFGPTSGTNPTLTVNGGTVRLGSASALPSDRVVNLAPASSGSATLDLNGFAATVGTLNFGDNTTNGAMTVTGGTLTAPVIRAGQGSASTVAPTISSHLDVGTATTITITNNPSATLFDLILTGPLTGAGTITRDGSATAVLLVAGANNTFSGLLSIQSGSVRLGAVNALGRTAQVDTGGSSTNILQTAIGSGQGFTAGAFTQSLGSVTGSGILQVGDTTHSAALLVGFGAGDFTFAGQVIAFNAGSHLAKVGPGTMTLTGASTAVTGSLAVRGGAVVIQGGGTLTTTGTAGTVTISQGATLHLDNTSQAVGNRLTDTAPINLAGGTFRLTGNSGAPTSETVGALTAGGGQSTVFVSPSAAQPAQLAFASGTGGPGTVFFRGPSLGQAPAAGVATVQFTTAPSLVGGGGSGAQTSVLPWGLGSSTGGAAPDTLVTVGANGVRPLDPAAEFAPYATAGTTVNVRESASFTVAAADTRNALVTTGGAAQTVTLNADLTLTSGAFLNTGAGTQVTGSGTLTFGPSGAATAYVTAEGNLTLAAPASAGGLVKSGAGTLTVQRPVAVSGGTVTVAAGTLAVANNGTTTTGGFTSAGGVTYRVTPGATLDVSGVSAGFSVGTNTKLQGGGTIAGAVTVAPGGTLEPTALPGPGVLSVADMTWQSGGTYRWQVASALGSNDGVTQSRVDGTGTLDLTGLSTGNRFTVQLVPLAPNNTSGAVYDFDNTKSYNWVIATFGGIAAFSADKFMVDSAAFAAVNPLNGGVFGVSQTGNSLSLTFSPVPEPGSVLPFAGLVLITGRVVRCRLRGRAKLPGY
jgi:hypothetical protein